MLEYKIDLKLHNKSYGIPITFTEAELRSLEVPPKLEAILRAEGIVAEALSMGDTFLENNIRLSIECTGVTLVRGKERS